MSLREGAIEAILHGIDNAPYIDTPQGSRMDGGFVLDALLDYLTENQEALEDNPFTLDLLAVLRVVEENET